jgi:hypothetical protein
VALDLDMHEEFSAASRRPAYERLYLDALEGNGTLFVRRDETEAAWEWGRCRPRRMAGERHHAAAVSCGDVGPASAIAMTERHGHSWRDKARVPAHGWPGWRMTIPMATRCAGAGGSASAMCAFGAGDGGGSRDPPFALGRVSHAVARLPRARGDGAGLARVVLMPTDERCVPHDHRACNVREMRAAVAPATGVRVASLTVDDGDPTVRWRSTQPCVAHSRRLRCRRARHGQTSAYGVAVPGRGTAGERIDPGQAAMPAASIPIRCRPKRRSRASPCRCHACCDARLHLAIDGDGKRACCARRSASRSVRHPISALLHAPDARVHVHLESDLMACIP